MPEVRMSVSDALFAIAAQTTIEPGGRYAIRKLPQRLVDSAWADGYTDACRDKADEKAAS